MSWMVKRVGDDRKLLRAWVDVAVGCHAGDPNWVPPLRADVLKGADRRHNPFLRHAQVEHFVLFEEDRPVGRTAATV